MKKIFFLLIYIAGLLHAQMIVSPYVVYTDQHDKFASMIVENGTTKPYDVTISFLFGYPVSDSLGNMTMKYIKSPSSDMPSLLNYVKAFPRRFTLNPGQKQIVRMIVQPPSNLRPGTYWLRIVTSTTKQVPMADINSSNKGISARINYVLNQITTLIYSTDGATTGVDMKNNEIEKKNGKINFLTFLTRTGNSPFFGKIKVSIFNSADALVTSNFLREKVYFNLVVRNSFNLNKLKPGNYKAKIEVASDEKEEIPKSKMPDIKPIIKTLAFKIK